MSIPAAVSKPVRAWNASFDFNYRKLFVTTGKLAVDLATFNAAGAIGNVLELVNAADLRDREWQDIAWVWLTRAMGRAVIAVIDRDKKNWNVKALDEAAIEKMAADLEAAVDDVVVQVLPDFFDNPRPAELLDVLIPQFQRWLERLGVEERPARYGAASLSDQFVLSFHTEWMDAPETYDKVLQTVQGPAAKASMEVIKWGHYRAQLAAMPNERVFDEDFSISDVYVDLRGSYEVDVKRDKDDTGDEQDEMDKTDAAIHDSLHARETIHRAMYLMDHVTKWINEEDTKDCVRLIHGGPGCGKSTFARQLAADMAADRTWTTMFIPLHRFNVERSLISSLDAYCEDTRDCPGKPLKNKSMHPRILLILDGLDELSESGRFGEETAKRFTANIKSDLSDLNRDKIRLKVIITGRDLAIQKQRTSFMDPGQVLSVLPYRLLSEEEKEGKHSESEYRDYYFDHDKILEEDQRDQWWKKYSDAMGLALDEAPPEIAEDTLDDITAQPLLNYLVSLCMENGTLDLKATDNLNTVYHRLLTRVYERDREKPRADLIIPDLSIDDFTRIMEEIAVTAWQDGSDRTTSMSRLTARAEQDRSFKKLFDKFQMHTEQGFVNLLTAFYCKDSGRRTEEGATYEFTHKSFREFLTALAIVRTVKRFADRMTRDDLVEDAALEEWARLCGPMAMDRDLFAFVRQEFQRHKTTVRNKWLKTLVELMNYTLKHGIPVDKCGLKDFRTMRHHARNAEEALLACLSACIPLARKPGSKPVKLTWPGNSKTAFGELLTRLRGQRSGPDNPLAYACLHTLALSGQYLAIADLYNAFLFDSDLTRVELPLADLTRANLIAATLEGANLTGANLSEADLTRANLREADLTEANLTDAKLIRALLTDANLNGANLTRADLTRADLRKADLTGANLTVADLRGADLTGANLIRADLTRANLKEANLTRAKLIEANLIGANLTKAKLRGADLNGANLTRADLTDANLREADLRGADLRMAELSQQQLDSAILSAKTILPDWSHPTPEMLGNEDDD